MKDIRQSPEWARYLESLGWKTEKLDGVNCFVKKTPFFGSIIKIQRPPNLPPIEKIEKLAKKNRAILVKIEPTSKKEAEILKRAGFKLSRWPLSPTKTVVLDLSKSEETLLGKMHYKTRYNIKVAQRNKVKVEISDDFKSFCKVWLESQKRNKLSFATTSQLEKFWQIFQKNSVLLLAKDKKDETLAGILMPIYDRIAYYLYAGSTKGGNKLFAPTLVTWEAIKLAKKMGARQFDFEGIYDERFKGATKSWQGFSRFKKSFGGKEIEYPGTFSKTFLPFGKLFSS